LVPREKGRENGGGNILSAEFSGELGSACAYMIARSRWTVEMGEEKMLAGPSSPFLCNAEKITQTVSFSVTRQELDNVFGVIG
jgi:hypothetical protein